MNDKKWIFLFLAWVITLVSSLGSLFFSEVMRYAPCTLCWYQRIFMFPLTIVLLRALISADYSVTRYALPLSFSGTLVALYHNLLYFGVIPESLSPCIQGASCLTRYFEFAGFITIPSLALIAFIVIDGLLLTLSRNHNEK